METKQVIEIPFSITSTLAGKSLFIEEYQLLENAREIIRLILTKTQVET